MKKVFLSIVLLLVAFSVKAQEASLINWMTLEEAVAAQAKEPKKIMMDMYTTWCGPCKMLDKNTFNNSDVADYVNKNYYAVKFNAEGNSSVTFQDKKFSNPNYIPNKQGRNNQHELAGYLGVSAYPTIIFLDESSALLFNLRGYQDPNQLELYLKLFATDKFKEITTQEQFQDYVKNFVPDFKI